jgi:hypothetical protein
MMKLVGLCAVAAGVGCAGLDTGNANDVATIKVALSAGPGQPVDANGTAFAVTKADATVERVDLYLPAGVSCAEVPGLGAAGSASKFTCESDKIRANGPWRVNLLTGAAVPAFPAVPVVEGTYRRIDVEFEDDDADLVLEGTVPLNNQSVPFRFRGELDAEVRFEGAEVVARLDQAAQAILKLDPTGWFAGVPIAQCVADGDLEIVGGVLELADGDGACDDIEDLIEDALSGSGEIDDDDGFDD